MSSTSAFGTALALAASTVVVGFDIEVAASTPHALASPTVGAQAAEAAPAIHVYKTVDGVDLTLHVFAPRTRETGARPAIVFIHGGGWAIGEPAWAYSQARHYAAKGLTTIAVQYRLSDQRRVTPREAMADTRDAFRWIRVHARELRVDPRRIAAYGWSAGGHLGAAAFAFEDAASSPGSAAPNALILMSPAVSLPSTNGYMRRLLLGGDPRSVSPADHLRRGVPPALIFSGEADVVTPTAGSRRFCDAAARVGGRCELHVYPGLGHMLSRTLDRRAQEEGPFDPDPKAIADAFAKTDAFLASLGFL